MRSAESLHRMRAAAVACSSRGPPTAASRHTRDSSTATSGGARPTAPRCWRATMTNSRRPRRRPTCMAARAAARLGREAPWAESPERWEASLGGSSRHAKDERPRRHADFSLDVLDQVAAREAAALGTLARARGKRERRRRPARTDRAARRATGRPAAAPRLARLLYLARPPPGAAARRPRRGRRSAVAPRAEAEQDRHALGGAHDAGGARTKGGAPRKEGTGSLSEDVAKTSALQPTLSSTSKKSGSYLPARAP